MTDPAIEVDVIKDSAPEEVELRLRFMFDQRALAQDQIEGYQQSIVELELELKRTQGLLGLQYDLLADIENEIKTLQVELRVINALDEDQEVESEEDGSSSTGVAEEFSELKDDLGMHIYGLRLSQDTVKREPEEPTLEDLLPNAAEIRKAAGWSQGAVGIELGFDRATGQSKVSSWERGVRVPHGERAEAYRELLLRLRG